MYPSFWMSHTSRMRDFPVFNRHRRRPSCIAGCCSCYVRDEMDITTWMHLQVRANTFDIWRPVIFVWGGGSINVEANEKSMDSTCTWGWHGQKICNCFSYICSPLCQPAIVRQIHVHVDYLWHGEFYSCCFPGRPNRSTVSHTVQPARKNGKFNSKTLLVLCSV